MATIMVKLLYPDLAVASLNGGVDACAGGGAGSPQCQKIIAKASAVGAMFQTAAGFLSIFVIPFIGSCSDHYGRRPMLILGCLSSKVALIALICDVYVGTSIYYFFVGAMIPNIFSIPMLMWLWISDQTPPNERGKMFGRLAAATNIEGVVVPFVAVLARNGKVAVLVLAFVRVFGLLVLIFGVRESRPPDMLDSSARSMFSDGRSAFFQRWRGISQLFADKDLRLLILSGMIGTFASAGATGVQFLFCKEKFGATMETFAPLVALATLSNLLVQLFILKPLENRVGIRGVFILAASAGAGLMIAMALAPTLHWQYLVNVFWGLSTIGLPAFQTVLSNVAGTVPGLSPAVALGALQAIVSLMTMAGDPAFEGILSSSLHLPVGGRIHPEAPFLFGAVLYVVVVMVLLCVPRELFDRGL
ncbi:Mfsd14b [Symbiodinium natans]|uniref:Mfsd14b protein n=1 Tax=Symbiodinium natans TaxID=878477 RepID=A0A812J7M9_9DINO|nr:Mfsd14b [Symbiodinium natans]